MKMYYSILLYNNTIQIEVLLFYFQLQYTTSHKNKKVSWEDLIEK